MRVLVEFIILNVLFESENCWLHFCNLIYSSGVLVELLMESMGDQRLNYEKRTNLSQESMRDATE